MRSNFWWATFAVLALGAAPAVAAPRCAERVQALEKLAAATQAPRFSEFLPLDFQTAAHLPVVTGTEKPKAIQQTGGFKLWLDRGPLGDNARILQALNGQSGLVLCMSPDPGAALPPPTHRSDADAEVLKPVVAALKGASPDTWQLKVLESLQGVGTLRCAAVGRTARAIMHVAPEEQASILAKSQAENLTRCACPDGIAEAVYAHVTLLADLTPAVSPQCVLVLPPSVAKAESIEISPSARAEDLVQRLLKAQGKPVRLKSVP